MRTCTAGALLSIQFVRAPRLIKFTVAGTDIPVSGTHDCSLPAGRDERHVVQGHETGEHCTFAELMSTGRLARPRL